MSTAPSLWGVAALSPNPPIYGSSADDTTGGTDDADFFLLDQGGADNVSGGAGGDSFYFGTTLGLGDRVEQSGIVSMVQPADDAPISLAAARAAQVSLDALAEGAPPVSRVEVLQLDAGRLVIRPEGRPQIVACERLR